MGKKILSPSAQGCNPRPLLLFPGGSPISCKGLVGAWNTILWPPLDLGVGLLSPRYLLPSAHLPPTFPYTIHQLLPSSDLDNSGL